MENSLHHLCVRVLFACVLFCELCVFFVSISHPPPGGYLEKLTNTQVSDLGGVLLVCCCSFLFLLSCLFLLSVLIPCLFLMFTAFINTTTKTYFLTRLAIMNLPSLACVCCCSCSGVCIVGICFCVSVFLCVYLFVLLS